MTLGKNRPMRKGRAEAPLWKNCFFVGAKGPGKMWCHPRIPPKAPKVIMPLKFPGNPEIGASPVVKGTPTPTKSGIKGTNF